jgi:hypothetical protein
LTKSQVNSFFTKFSKISKTESLFETFNDTLNETAYSIVETQDRFIEQILNKTISPYSDPYIIISLKAVLIIAITLLTIFAVAAFTATVVLLIDILHFCYIKHKTYRQKHRLELIPTYHNVRVLRQQVSRSSLPTPPNSPELRRLSTFQHV